MPLMMKATAGGGVHIPPGTYPVTCTDVREDKIEKSQFSPDVIRFDLDVELFDANGDQVKLDAIAAQKLSPKSKLWRWLTAFGVDVSVDADIDIEACIGLSCLAVVKDNEPKDGMPPLSKVDDLIPLPASGKANANIAELSIADWWKLTRDKGFSLKEMRDGSDSMYGKEPKDLDGQERAALLEAMPI